jgi:organic hydroperoxide reductase OsmC/OhrA
MALSESNHTRLNKTHQYKISIRWEGNTGKGTAGYREYLRDFRIFGANKKELPGSSDPSFRGDPSRYNPEELLVASLSACHMLWYLHLCADEGIVVTEYTDQAEGSMIENPDGSGQFKEVILRPRVRVQHESMILKARALHESARSYCFIARSCNFPVNHVPEIIV